MAAGANCASPLEELISSVKANRLRTRCFFMGIRILNKVRTIGHKNGRKVETSFRLSAFPVCLFPKIAFFEGTKQAYGLLFFKLKINIIHLKLNYIDF
jgi:hypothetical protein